MVLLLHIDEAGYVLKGIQVGDNRQLEWTIAELGFTDQLHPLLTIDLLPDDVLIEIFDSYLIQDGRVDAWHTLVHVCRRWRYLVFAVPRRLNLQILCNPKQPVMITLDVWPALPIVIDFAAVGYRPWDMANIMVALMQHDRVCKINIRDIPNSLLEAIAKVKKPFPALTELKISCHGYARVVPDSFLAGSTPRLQSLWLVGIPFPTLGKLLLSTNDLVDLGLWKIPHSGYISPETMVATLSALTRLKKLVLGFQFSRPQALASRQRPLDARVVLPALTMLYFKGDSEYLEDLVSRIDTPRLESVKITFFSQRLFYTSLLRDFIGRTDTLQEPHRAQVVFYPFGVEITLFRERGMRDGETLKLGISCRTAGGQLSGLAQVCKSIMRPLHALERLGIYEYHDEELDWPPGMGSTQWLELLRPFTRVKDLVLSKILVRLVARTLQERAGERVTEVLPLLRTIFLEGSQPLGSVGEAIAMFLDARQLSGYPVLCLSGQ